MLWRQYQLSIDLYKFYLDLVVKAIIGYYAITAGVLSFYFTRSEMTLARGALLLPCALSFALAALFRWGATRWKLVEDDAHEITDKLGLQVGFDLSVLRTLLLGAAIFLAITGLVILAIMSGAI